MAEPQIPGWVALLEYNQVQFNISFTWVFKVMRLILLHIRVFIYYINLTVHIDFAYLKSRSVYEMMHCRLNKSNSSFASTKHEKAAYSQ